MNAKEMLVSYGDLVRRAEVIRRGLTRLRTFLEEHPEDRERTEGRMRLLESQEKALRQTVSTRQKDIQQAVMLLPDELGRIVLTLRYLEQLTFREIGKSVGLSERHLYRTHRNAVEQLQNLWFDDMSGSGLM